MEANKHKYTHIWISVAFFIICLAFPGYYIREYQEPQHAYDLMLMGWLGALDGHFSWYANLLYIIAVLTCKKAKTSSVLGFSALSLALSFLCYDKIIVSEAPTYALISGYGWGYYFWVVSLGIYFIGQLLLVYSPKNNESRKRIFAIQSSWVSIVLVLFSLQYFIGEDSPYSIKKSRSTVFNEKCKIAGEQIYKKANDVTGVFVSSYVGGRYKEIKQGIWFHEGSGSFPSGHLNSGLIKFYEKENKRSSNPKSIDSLPYRRYLLGDYKGSEISHLESDYAVIPKSFDIPKTLHIDGAEILIKDLKNDTIIAKSTYVFDHINRKFCGHSRDGYFSPSKFIIETLNLSRKYPSIYDNK